MTRCISCRCELEDDDDAMPVCPPCKGDGTQPELRVIDRDALHAEYLALVGEASP